MIPGVDGFLSGIALLTNKERIELFKELSATYCSFCGSSTICRHNKHVLNTEDA